jgi:hypothetical protein
MMKCGTTGFWITGEKSQSELEGIVKDEGIKSCLYLSKCVSIVFLLSIL